MAEGPISPNALYLKSNNIPRFHNKPKNIGMVEVGDAPREIDAGHF